MPKVTQQHQQLNHDSIARNMRTGCLKFGEQQGCPPEPQGMGPADVLDFLAQILGIG